MEFNHNTFSRNKNISFEKEKEKLRDRVRIAYSKGDNRITTFIPNCPNDIIETVLIEFRNNGMPDISFKKKMGFITIDLGF